MADCKNCCQTWCQYRGTDGSLVFNCKMFLEMAMTQTSDGTYYQDSVARKTEKPLVQTLSDVEILTEFKRRFKDSVLYDCNISELLYIIGESKLKEFMKKKRK